MRPWEFYRYTPGQWRQTVTGYAEKKKAEKLNLAWAVANLMNSTGNYKKPIKPHELIGEKSPQQAVKKSTPEELEALKKRFGGGQ